MRGDRRVYFKEVQQFRQIWLWLVILPIVGLIWYGFIQQIVFKEPFGRNPPPDVMMWGLWVLFGIALPLFFYILKLIVEIDGEAIYIRFFPLTTRKIPLEEVKSYKALTYRPIRDYGGWGIRYGLKGKAYSVSGNRGVQIELYNGRRILIGSREPEEIVRAIDLAKGDEKG
ncbi:MAG: DUF6141 family protein [Candidatus Methanospirareceae archaeon]